MAFGNSCGSRASPIDRLKPFRSSIGKVGFERNQTFNLADLNDRLWVGTVAVEIAAYDLIAAVRATERYAAERQG